MAFCCYYFISLAQQNKIDSLLLLLKTDKADTNKLNHLNKLTREYNGIGSYDSALFYAHSALKLSTVIVNGTKQSGVKQIAQKGKASAYNNIGVTYYNQGNFPEALNNQLVSLKIREEIGDQAGIASSYNNIGNVYYDQGNYPEALKNYFASLKLREAIGNKKDIATSYNNIGIVYDSQNNYPEALKNYFVALKIFEALGDPQGIAHSHNNIGVTYKEQGNYPEALKNYLASLKIREAIGDKDGIAYSYHNIGNIYCAQGNYPEALHDYFASLKIREAIGDKAGIATSYNNIGIIYTKQKKYKEAEEYLMKAKELSKEIGYIEYLRDSYSDLTNLDSAKGNFKGAYENYKLHILYRDSLDNEETRKKTVQSQMTYDFEKKEAATKSEQEKKDAVAAAENKRQRLFFWLIAAVAMAVAVIAVIIFRSLRITRKQKNIIELQKNEVLQQKEIVEQQKKIVEEHQKEIIDSITYAKRLQEAILPPTSYVNEHLPDNFILYKPKDIVAGDFYWMEELDNIIFIAAADCTGHGVPGAMVSVVCSNALNRAVKEFHLRDTGKILDKVTELVLETFAKSDKDVKDGMDISLLSVNNAARQINWSGAYNSLVYIPNGEAIEVPADKQPIGKHDNRKPFTVNSIPFQTGTVFYLFTDGYADQFGGPKCKKFMYRKMQKKLSDISSKPMSEQKKILDETITEWKGNNEQVDDICVIGVRL